MDEVDAFHTALGKIWILPFSPFIYMGRVDFFFLWALVKQPGQEMENYEIRISW